MRIIDTEIVKIITTKEGGSGLPFDDNVVLVDIEGNKDNLTFVYEMPVTIDLRKALERNIDKITVKLLTIPMDQIMTRTSFGEAGNSGEPIGVNEGIQTFREEDLIKTLNKNSEYTITTTNIDFTDLLNNQIVSNFRNLTDKELFGTSPTIITEPESKENRFYNNLTIPLNNLPNDVSTLSFDQSTDMLYQLGIDPASAFYANEDELSYTKSRGGLALDSYYNKNRGASIEVKLKNALRHAYISQINSEYFYRANQQTRKNPNNTNYTTYEIDEVNRYQQVKAKFKVSENDIARASGALNIVVTAEDFLGVILDLRENTYTHKFNLQRSQVSPPDLHLAGIRAGVNDDIPTLAITNNSVFDNDVVSIYAKITNECSNYYSSKFIKVGSCKLSAGETKIFKPSNSVSGHSSLQNRILRSLGSILFRVIVEKPDYSNTFYCRIPSKSAEQVKFLPLDCRSTGNSITIVAKDIPGSVIGVEIVRRNKTLNEKDFKPIKGISRNFNAIPVGIKWSINSNNPLAFSDELVKNENTYEYKAMLYYETGLPHMTLNSVVIEYLEKTNIVEVVFSENFDSKTIASTGGFEFSVRRINSLIDNVFTKLSSVFSTEDISQDNSQLYNAFKSQFDTLKSQLDKYIDVEVSRYNVITGADEVIGIYSAHFPPNSITSAFVRVPVVTSSSNKYMSYVYKLQPRVRPMYDLMVDLRKTIKDLGHTTNAAITGIDYTGLVDSLLDISGEQILSTTENKFHTRNALKKSTLQSAEQYAAESANDSMYYGRTGDIKYFVYNSLNPSIDIHRTNLKRVRLNPIPMHTLTFNEYVNSGGTLITNSARRGKFKDQFNKAIMINFVMSGDINYVDFVILYSQKNGIINIVGSFHMSQNGIVNYIDNSHLDYIGAITYFAQPVFQNQKRGNEFNLGTIIVGNDSGVV